MNNMPFALVIWGKFPHDGNQEAAFAPLTLPLDSCFIQTPQCLSYLIDILGAVMPAFWKSENVAYNVFRNINTT